MSFFSDLGSFIGDVNDFKEEITASFKAVGDEAASLQDEASKLGEDFLDEVKQASEEIDKQS